MRATFTIAVPTHDRRETVVLAVRSALAQTRPPEQVIVLCDGCTDGTADALRALGDPRVDVLELEKAAGYGYEHRNRSLERARGEAIVWLGDDDLLLPDHLERLGELWDAGTIDMAQSSGVVVLPGDELEWFGADWGVPAYRARLDRYNTNPMGSVSVRVALARAVGGWDASRLRNADWDLWRRMLDAGARCAASAEPTLLHFRASGREQPWPERVRQNAAWLARLEDPLQLRDLRVVLRRTGAARDADLLDRADQLHEALLHALGERDAAQAERDRAFERLATAEAESARHAAALARIEAGGWWRLRRRLLPLLRLVGRAR